VESERASWAMTEAFELRAMVRRARVGGEERESGGGSGRLRLAGREFLIQALGLRLSSTGARRRPTTPSCPPDDESPSPSARSLDRRFATRKHSRSRHLQSPRIDPRFLQSQSGRPQGLCHVAFARPRARPVVRASRPGPPPSSSVRLEPPFRPWPASSATNG
jgi:hypothetical protein